MYLHHTPTAKDDIICSSSIIRANICVIDKKLTALSTFKISEINKGDDIMYMKVLYKVADITQYRKQTQIIAHEA